MRARYSESETVATVERLTVTRLRTYVAAECLAPVEREGALEFSDADLARLELLSDLSESFDLDEEALGLVMSLIDQIHGLRAELRALGEAVGAEPEDVRARIRTTYRSRRS
jgi:chaperone modulatory protein CbpM